MKELYFDPNWTYNELTLNLKMLRTQYREIVASFSYFQKKEKIAFERKAKKTIYSYPYQEFLCNFAWNYLTLPEYTTDYSDDDINIEIDDSFIDEILKEDDTSSELDKNNFL